MHAPPVTHLQRLLSRWRADPEIGGNVAVWQTLPARSPNWQPFPSGLHPALAGALRQRGIDALYSHQADAYSLSLAREHFIVVTGTASGKSTCYNLPVIDRLLTVPETRALYIFPTKALAQDQASSLQALLRGVNDANPMLERQDLLAAVYDGDTPAARRPSIRKNARIVITNPDMLHTGILPHHTAWADYFHNLQFVVIDELHTYRGVFGSHVANVLRRLRRVAAFYGSWPQFILTSATIANPAELAERLVEAPVKLIDADGSGRGPKSFLIYNPPVVDPELGLRRSAFQEAVRLAEDLLAENVQTLVFGRSRRSIELILTYLRQRAAALPYHDADASPPEVRGYRSGYLPRQRREIEQGLRTGQVRAVVATNALELGVDIGGMDAAVLVGYPGSIASTWQQAGRSGRGAAPSLSIMVATPDPLDQFLAAHPEYIFDRSPEQALINPDNLLILLAHLRCAAFEIPFREGDAFGSLSANTVAEFLDFLVEQGDLHASGDKYFWMADQYPAQTASLRSASADNVVLQVVDAGGGEPAVLGQVDQASACWMVHPEAIYLHDGRSYFVESLDLTEKAARLRRVEVDYYTEPRQETTVALVEELALQDVPGGRKAYGEIQVTTQMVGFRKLRWYTNEQLGLGEVDLPPSELHTTGYWLALFPETVASLVEQGLWTNAPNQYGLEWRTLKDQVRQRDGYRCQVCGIPEQGRSHDVHHKTPFRTFSDSRLANQLSNLVTLCPACHRRVETAVRVRSGLAGLSFILSHLAPLFLMCDGRDLGVHSDPQLTLAQGQPGVVIYDQAPAGIGLSERLFSLHHDILAQAGELVAACKCSDGCPSCVGPGGENGQGSKRETLAIVHSLLPASVKGK